MRLIDADALIKAMYHRAFETDGDTMWQSGCWVRYRAIEQTVKEQPTIEPERNEKLLTAISKEAYESGYNDGMVDAGTRLTTLRPEREHGKWISTRPDAPMFGANYCSECGARCTDIKHNFCPNCGADMRGEQDG